RFSPTSSDSLYTLMTLEVELQAILPSLLTKADFEALSDRLSQVVQMEIARMHADLANVDTRVLVAEVETWSLHTDLKQTITAVMGCETDLAHVTNWVDDLENHGHRLNLCIRG
ncbi:Hypothetical predicted protein, partial [Pelobates cultripes]